MIDLHIHPDASTLKGVSPTAEMSNNAVIGDDTSSIESFSSVLAVSERAVSDHGIVNEPRARSMNGESLVTKMGVDRAVGIMLEIERESLQSETPNHGNPDVGSDSMADGKEMDPLSILPSEMALLIHGSGEQIQPAIPDATSKPMSEPIIPPQHHQTRVPTMVSANAGLAGNLTMSEDHLGLDPLWETVDGEMPEALVRREQSHASNGVGNRVFEPVLRSSVLEDPVSAKPVVSPKSDLALDLSGGIKNVTVRHDGTVHNVFASDSKDDSIGQGLSRDHDSFHSNFGHSQGDSSRGHVASPLSMGHFDEKVGIPTIAGRTATASNGVIIEERPAAALAFGPHRLQLEVPLSTTSMLQLDVSVQQRNVSASLLVDHPMIRNLAAQQVLQLEEQLEQVGLHLREFEAQSHERREGESALFEEGRPMQGEIGAFGPRRSRRSDSTGQADNLAASPIEDEPRVHIVA